MVNLNCSVIGVCDPVDLGGLLEHNQGSDQPRGTRIVVFDGQRIDTPIFWRDDLPRDIQIEGPAVIEQMDTTVLVDPGVIVRGRTGQSGYGDRVMKVRGAIENFRQNVARVLQSVTDGKVRPHGA